MEPDPRPLPRRRDRLAEGGVACRA
ncbi:MAG TPA: hypothetical protein VGA62_11230, partial [Acidimicrobiia bacterium]